MIDFTIESVVKWLQENNYDFHIVREEKLDAISSKLVQYSSEKFVMCGKNPFVIENTDGAIN